MRTTGTADAGKKTGKMEMRAAKPTRDRKQHAERMTPDDLIAFPSIEKER